MGDWRSLDETHQRARNAGSAQQVPRCHARASAHDCAAAVAKAAAAAGSASTTLETPHTAPLAAAAQGWLVLVLRIACLAITATGGLNKAAREFTRMRLT
jgi:hypothetical protein